MQTSTAAEAETVSRAEYEALQAERDALQEQLTAKSRELAAALLKNDWLLEQLKIDKKKLYGQSSEAAMDAVLEQLSLFFNEAEAIDAASYEPATKVKEHSRKRRSGSVDDAIPEDLPVERVEHRLSEEERKCPVCGTEMVEIGREVHRTLVIKQPAFSVREDVYYTYAYKACEKESDEAVIVNTPREPGVFPGSFASPEAIAYIMTQKYVMYSPLYRLEQEMERAGIKLTRQTMSNWLLHASDDWLKPVYEQLHRKLLKRSVLHAENDAPGPEGTRKGGDGQELYVSVPDKRRRGASDRALRLPAEPKVGECGSVSPGLLGMAPRRRVPGLPQAAGADSGSRLLGARQKEV